MLPTKFRFIWTSGFRGEDFFKSAYQKQELPVALKLGRKHLWKVLYKDCSFCSDPLTNMAATGNSCFWLADLKKIFSSETAWPNEPKLGRKHLWKVLFKDCSFRRRTTDAKWWQKLTLRLVRWSNKNYIETRKDFWLPLKNYGELGRNEKNSLCSGSDEPNFFEIYERYKDCSFCSYPLTNMAATGNSCFWLADLKKIFSETALPNKPKLGRKHLWQVLYKVCSFRPNQKQELFVVARFVKGSWRNEQTW
jgi:hypothetical protein